jgi:hypothetical protein
MAADRQQLFLLKPTKDAFGAEGGMYWRIFRMSLLLQQSYCLVDWHDSIWLSL